MDCDWDVCNRCYQQWKDTRLANQEDVDASTYINCNPGASFTVQVTGSCVSRELLFRFLRAQFLLLFPLRLTYLFLRLPWSSWLRNCLRNVPRCCGSPRQSTHVLGNNILQIYILLEMA